MSSLSSLLVAFGFFVNNFRFAQFQGQMFIFNRNQKPWSHTDFFSRGCNLIKADSSKKRIWLSTLLKWRQPSKSKLKSFFAAIRIYENLYFKIYKSSWLLFLIYRFWQIFIAANIVLFWFEHYLSEVGNQKKEKEKRGQADYASPLRIDRRLHLL